MSTVILNSKKARFPVWGMILILLLSAIFLIFSQSVTEAALGAMHLCVTSLIPNLFPFLVLNGLLIRSGFPERIGKTIGKPFGKWLGIHPSCVSAVFIGLMCGFPSGAAAAFQIHSKGLCGKKDLDRTAYLSSLASPAYVIVGVGGGLLGNRRIGLMLWILQILANITVGMVDARLRPQPTIDYSYDAPSTHSFLRSFSDALKDGVNAILSICGSVIFFSVLGGVMRLVPFPHTLHCLIACLIELSSGVALCASTLPFPVCFLFIAFAMGWSGLSVQVQTVAVTEGCLSLRSFMLHKLLVSLLSGLLAFVILGFRWV